MTSVNIILWCIIVGGLVIAYLAWRFDRPIEKFAGNIDFSSFSMQARDAAPTTSELKNHYKGLLIYVDDKIRNGKNVDNDKDQGGRRAMCILSSLGQILYNRPTLKNIVPDDVLSNWPAWLTPISTTIKEPVPTADVANTARMKILAFLQKNFPQTDTVDEDTGSTVRNLYTDIGRRFFFNDGEPVQLRDDLMTTSITNNITSC